MNVLVTGGAGFIGSHCVEDLLTRGFRVRVLDNLSTGKIENIQGLMDRIEFIEADLENAAAARSAVEGMDYVVHLAAIPSVQFSIREPVKSHQSMLTATLSLFKAAVDYGGIRRIVQAVSAAAYGSSAELPKREDMKPDPLSPYAVAKLAQEYYGKVFYSIYDLQVISLRFFNVYGPRQDPASPYSGVISIFLDRMLDGKPPVVFGDGSQTRDFIHVSDVTAAVRQACLAIWPGRSEVINIGTGRQTSLNQLADTLNKILGTGLKPVFTPDRPGDVHHSLADITKAQKLLDFRPAVDLEEGLRSLVRFRLSSGTE